MSDVISARTPGQIASEINLIKEQSGQMLLVNAVEIGRRLTEAKKLVPHGEWINWLKESVSYSRSTAARLMKTYREYGPKLTSPDGEDSSNVAALHHLGYMQGLILFGVPDEEREQFVADNGVETMSARELQQTVKERKQASEENDQNSEASPGTAKIQEPWNGLETGKQQELERAAEPIPVVTKVIMPKPVRPAESVHPDSERYDTQYAMHRDNILNAYAELLKTLVALDRTDPVKKERNRKEALKIATNMATTLKEYPPRIKTNLKIHGNTTLP
ncbi:Protein of unknown function (DUF3102) [Desulfitobacterium dehalogenans ATCC 51507]|uniref:DUF3102 domain-containing protein n=1 Tax=Desulfitobacterium dehalogenans (strain ATCC 51507 / DSM 9161 / JW/IU-DC1) TaxID=756499 RepID=I4A7F9_DESDJ|nr:DUF3102 domain-containing protein [Desulfitobacterium dehalogenans]AFL99893.1 Protein of unknown function (DUF3102) [Desulfitobacterium dehalogenans ATCC 51507]